MEEKTNPKITVGTEIEDQAYKYWQDLIISHLSQTSNLLTTLSTGFLVFSFSRSDFSKSIETTNNTANSLSSASNLLSLMLITFSVVLGMIAIFVRLNDFRLGRNQAMILRRLKGQDNLPEWVLQEINEKEFEPPAWRTRVKMIVSVLLSKNELISRKKLYDILESQNYKLLQNKLTKLKLDMFILGTISWKIPNQQLFLIIMSVILYVTSLVI